ncbi:MAG: phosphodiester glycosidase family protein [Cyanosarcina radialis HA8281-LM2]|jgi:hypothetical protein|nr:phosphodiester glycosidase family protein [Cyanosarcina radialis HA8281-LM2]
MTINLLLIITILLHFVDRPAAAVTVPESFEEILSDRGVQVYKKNSASSKSDYVTVVNLQQGMLRNLTGTLTDVPNGKIERKSTNDFWNDAVRQNTSTRKARVVVNGTFFSQKYNPTPIAFGLKIAGTTVSYGYGLDEFPNLTTTFAFNSSTATASIQPYDLVTFDRDFPDVVGALDPAANKSAEKYLPRTFVGILDDDGDANTETVIFYSSNSARQIDAVNTLKSFGTSSEAMLDGGSSTGLIINGRTYIRASRTIPQAIAIYARK